MTTVRIILRRPEVERRTGKSRSSIYRDMSMGKFPKQVRVGRRAVGWFDDEIAEYQAACARGEI